jgi:hypothetical protein
MYDTRAWRGPAVVGGDGIDRRHPLSQRNMTQAVEDFWFWHKADVRVPSMNVRCREEQTLRLANHQGG